ncbi:MAG: SspB family protein [Methyloligellaceae bacterium]
MTGDQIHYEELAQEALRSVIRKVLQRVETGGLPGDHHFYVAFNTQADGVIISKRLKEHYPDEMTIVLQHQFWDLKAEESFFEIRLSFNNIPERLVVPYDAINVFFDPSVPYGLQFGTSDAANDDDRVEAVLPGIISDPDQVSALPTLHEPPVDDVKVESEEPPKQDGESGSAEIVELDTFRKK